VQQARAFALGGLRCLAGAPDNREVMWLDTRLRTAVVLGCRPVKNIIIDIRVNALGSLRALADSPGTKETMWRDGAVRQAIALGMEAAHPSEIAIRTQAVGAFRHLAAFAASRGVYVARRAPLGGIAESC